VQLKKGETQAPEPVRFTATFFCPGENYFIAFLLVSKQNSTKAEVPIPGFDHNGVLPPFIGDPAANPRNMSPYASTMLEVSQQWGGSEERRKILAGLLQLREALHKIGIVYGFQWLDGSFAEDCETTRSRPPGDIDVVTFFVLSSPIPAGLGALIKVLADRVATKSQFHVDHIAVPLTLHPVALVDQARYWFGLFSHRKTDRVWKGMLKVDLNAVSDDAQALAHIQSLSAP
jgi:hypothetical protein